MMAICLRSLQRRPFFAFQSKTVRGRSLPRPARSFALATGSSTYNLAFSYDRYGNMTCIRNAQTQGPCPQLNFNSANQISTPGYSYDAAGNLTADASTSSVSNYFWTVKDDHARGEHVRADGTLTSCYALAGAISIGATNVNPDSLRVAGGSRSFTASVPGGCVTTSDSFGNSSTHCSAGYTYIVTLPAPDWNSGALIPPAQQVLKTAGRIASPIAGLLAPVAWYGASAGAASLATYGPAGIATLGALAASHPAAWGYAMDFVQGLISPPGASSNWCVAAGQVMSGVWNSH